MVERQPESSDRAAVDDAAAAVHEPPADQAPIGPAVRFGLPALLAAAADAAIVRAGGRSVAVSLMAGAVLGIVVAISLWLRQRSRTRTPTTRGRSSAPAGSWSNPSRGQRMARRLTAGRTGSAAHRPNPLGDRRPRR